MTARILDLDDALTGPDYAPSGPVRLTLAEGRIVSIAPRDDGAVTDLVAIPALTDAHNHARPLSTTSFGCGMRPLETWLPRLAIIPPVDPYLAAIASLGRSLRGGCTAVMVHLTRAPGDGPLPEQARAIARAAADLGVSIGFAISMRDRNPLIYADHAHLLDQLSPQDHDLVTKTWLRPMPSVEAQLAQVDEVADAVAGLPGHIDVQYGPTGVQWCSDALLQAIADESRDSGRRVHMHLLETRPQREWADRQYPAGIVDQLDRIGLLSERLTLAHAVWANDDELNRIAAAGARIAVNPSSNLHLQSGIAPAARMSASGVSVAMGLDGCALDEDDDALREMRLLRLLNAGIAFGDGMSPEQVLRAACRAGRAGLGLTDGGVIAPGQPADLLILDRTLLDRDAVTSVPLIHYLFTRARQDHVREIVSGGRTVCLGGVLVGHDFDAIERQLRAEYRKAMPKMAPLVDVWARLETLLVRHYTEFGGCCG